MGRRRRRVVKIVKKKLPTVFSCPSCGEEAVRVAMKRAGRQGTVQCAECGLKEELEVSPADQIVDIYCKFTDRFYGVGERLAAKQEPVEPATQMQAEVQEEPEEAQTVEDEQPPQVMSNPVEGEVEADEASEGQTEETEQAAEEDAQVEASTA